MPPNMPPRRKALAKVATTLNVPLVRYGLLAVAVTLWSFGLVDQLQSTESIVKYLMLSALIGAIAMIG
jgi:hypothetical protein